MLKCTNLGWGSNFPLFSFFFGGGGYVVSGCSHTHLILKQQISINDMNFKDVFYSNTKILDLNMMCLALQVLVLVTSTSWKMLILLSFITFTCSLMGSRDRWLDKFQTKYSTSMLMKWGFFIYLLLISSLDMADLIEVLRFKTTLLCLMKINTWKKTDIHIW